MNDTIPFLGWAIKPIHLTAVYYAIWLFFGFFGTDSKSWRGGSIPEAIARWIAM